MEYKRIKDKIVFRLEMGDKLMESAQKIAATENVKLASINGIGACSKIEMGYIDLSIKEYIFKTFEGNMEILQATGNITLKDGEPFPHIHISVANEECKAFGGHLNEATISATFEGIMQIIDHEIHREFN
jgi:hypothetical protein